MSSSFSEIKKNITDKLSKELPNHLTYHDIEHTLYVLEKSVFIAKKEKVSKKDLRLIKIAALYHDSGFLKGPKDHEEMSCKIVKKDLKNVLDKEELKKVCGMIMATKIPQSPTNLCEQILADADLEYLGTKNFLPVGDKLYEELKHSNPKLSVKQWNEIQIGFIGKHSYHTKFCRQYREKYKQKNLEYLKTLI